MTYNKRVNLILTVAAVFVLLCVSELWWRGAKVHTELSRKFIHITVGSFVAFWPFFLSWHQIELLSLAFLIVVAISKYLHILKAIHSVQRPTWGELFFAIAVGLIAFITHDKWIYMTALLQMSLADGLAAIVGLRYGKKHKYLVFGQVKSIIGTSTFFVVSLATLLIYMHFGHTNVNLIALFCLAVVASLLENLGAWGLDNVFVPLVIAVSLRII
jgi:phytol kinase